MTVSNTVVRHLSCFPLGTRPARNAVSVRNCTTITVAFAYVSSWVLMVLLLQLLSLSLDPSFPNQALRRELCIVSCQVLNLLARPSPMKMGAFQPSFSCRLDPSFLPSFLPCFRPSSSSVDRPLLRWKSISGHAKGYPDQTRGYSRRPKFNFVATMQPPAST